MKKAPAFSQWSLRNRLLLATLVVAAIGIGASDFAANTELRGFLIHQVDTQLNSIASGTITRLARAGIDPNADDHTTIATTGAPTFQTVLPLRGVPTGTTVTLLDLNGAVLGQLGGDISSDPTGATFSGMTMDQVVATKGKAFTVHSQNPPSSTRAIAFVLPSNLGSVV